MENLHGAVTVFPVHYDEKTFSAKEGFNGSAPFGILHFGYKLGKETDICVDSVFCKCFPDFCFGSLRFLWISHHIVFELTNGFRKFYLLVL